MPNKKFGDWLSERLAERNMKPADITRATGLDSGVLSNIINNKRQQPSVDSCRAIAHALEIPLEEVYRAAGILDEKPNTDPITDAVLNLMGNLDTKEKQEILEYARLRSRLAARDQEVHNPRDTKGSKHGTAPA